MRNRNSYAGVGGSHFGMFGRSLVLREPEDGSTGGGATPEAPIATPETAPAASAKTFSQEQVNAIVAERLRKDRATRQPAQETTPAPAPKLTKAEIKSDVEQLREELARDRARFAFEKQATKLGIADEMIDDLFTLHDAQKPQDTKAWLEAKSGLFGLGKSNVAPNNSNNGGPAAPANAPASAPSAPAKVDPLTSGGLVDIFNLTHPQLEQIGPQGLREHFEKILQAATARAGAPPRPRIGQQRK